MVATTAGALASRLPGQSSVHDTRTIVETGREESVRGVPDKPWAWPDGHLGLFKSGSTSWIVAAGAPGVPVRCRGTLVAFRRKDCDRTRIQGLKRKYDYAAGGPVYRDQNTGTVLMFYHAESYLGGSYQRFYSLIGLAKSVDDGATWTDLGEIITPNLAFDPRSRITWDVGGAAYLAFGGHFHVYFRDKLRTGESAEIAVARAPIRAVLDAAISRDTVVPWTKYYGGEWTEPGLGGRSSPTEAQNAFAAHGDVSYNTYLRKFIMVTPGLPWPASNLYWLESADGVSWSGRQLLVDDPAHKVYVTIVGADPYQRVTGREFHIYYVTSRAAANGTGSRNSDGFLARRRIQVTQP